MGTFVFRWPYPADHVYVTGDFDDWSKSEKLEKVGDVFEKEVTLKNADAKHYYKFVVDDQWVVDNAAPKEDDGHYNVNNVLLPQDIKPTTSGHRVLATSRASFGSNSGAAALTQAPTVSAGGEGAPLITQEQSDANAARWIPHITPHPNRSNTRSLPQTDGAAVSSETNNVPGGFPQTPADELSVAPIPASGQPDVQSSVTTSKEDYEKAGGEGVTGDQQVSVAPLPAEGHKDIQSSVTTSKEDYENATGGEGTANNQEVSVNPLPATGHQDTQSSVTTTKEAYEKAGIAGAAGVVVAGAGAAIASAFSKPKEEDKDKSLIPESSLPMNPEKTDTTDTGPFISSAGPGTTTADLASKVPLEPKREAAVVGSEAPAPTKEETSTPFISSAGPGTTTAALASQVPVEEKSQAAVVDEPASPEVVAEKSAVDKELLAKVPESQATGEPASAAQAQTSYYGLATSVPEPVEASMAEAHASPEAATEPAVVAEKSAVERELAAKVPVEESAGEPAPTITAATASTAPGDAVANITDGKTANEAVPNTETSTQSRGTTAGEIAGGAAVGGAAAAGAAVLASKHEDKDAEPPRVDDSAKPTVTTEVAPATKTQDSVASPTSGFGAASPHPGVSPAAGAALSDGTEDPTVADEPAVTKRETPAEKSEATATEYAPPRAGGTAPGVSPAAAAALSDGTEDPTVSEDAALKEEPAVQMMKQNEAQAAGSAAPATPEKKETSAAEKVSTPAAAAATTSTPTKSTTTAGPAAAGTTTASAASTPAKSTTDSTATGDDKKKKKRHRLSQIIKKVFN